MFIWHDWRQPSTCLATLWILCNVSHYISHLSSLVVNNTLFMIVLVFSLENTESNHISEEWFPTAAQSQMSLRRPQTPQIDFFRKLTWQISSRKTGGRARTSRSTRDCSASIPGTNMLKARGFMNQSSWFSAAFLDHSLLWLTHFPYIKVGYIYRNIEQNTAIPVAGCTNWYRYICWQKHQLP